MAVRIVIMPVGMAVVVRMIVGVTVSMIVGMPVTAMLADEVGEPCVIHKIQLPQFAYYGLVLTHNDPQL